MATAVVKHWRGRLTRALDKINNFNYFNLNEIIGRDRLLTRWFPKAIEFWRPTGILGTRDLAINSCDLADVVLRLIGRDRLRA
jgi:hypothetical protein